MEQKGPERELQLTADGSQTLFVPQLNEHYHSVNGALQESLHVFIHAGFHRVKKDRLCVLEVGFGTGLNALLAWQEAERTGKKVVYHTVELYPIGDDLIQKLHYGALVCPDRPERFTALHRAPWGTAVEMSPHFVLHKIRGDVSVCALPDAIDLVFFDAFAPEKQPELWEPSVFRRLYLHASTGCVVVTYCAKGEVRRRMQQAGFGMERLPGPPGKRHILRGIKP